MAFMRREPAGTDLFALFDAAGRNVERGALLLRDLLADYPERQSLARDLKDAERDGDRITREIMVALRDGSQPLVIEPADGHALAAALDDVVDYAEQTADWLVLYRVEAPMDQASRLAALLAEATAHLPPAIAALRRGDGAIPHLTEIDRLEDEADALYRDAVAALFASAIDPMVVIRWKDIFETLESAVDACAKAAHVLDGISLKARS